jgi:phosphoglucomutase
MHPSSGKPAPRNLLLDVQRLERAYYDGRPDPANPAQRVSFGTSGHRGTPLDGSFTAAHVLAISQAICDYRIAQGISGPLFLGKDTHAASVLAERTALEVLSANGAHVCVQKGDGYTPTPVISHAILKANRAGGPPADGVVMTPSHNPPEDGGFKYNPPNGGPADTDVTGWIEDRANQLLENGNRDVRRATTVTLRSRDLVAPYVADLESAIDMDAIRKAGLRIGVAPLGGASVQYWPAIAGHYGLDITVTDDTIDPRFGFMTLDHDGRIRMDCSSPPAMASLVKLKNRFDIAFGNDPDADRHGIVTPSGGLMNPNHFLAVGIRHLLRHRPDWPVSCVIGKTLVSSAIIDRVVAAEGRRLMEVPVGFKWFTPGLYDGSCCFGGEESAGASFLRKDGSVWTTDKDGILLCLLAAEITAVTGKDPSQLYAELTSELGAPCYARVDTPCTAGQKAGFKRLTPESVAVDRLAGDPITAKLTRAPGNDAPIGGLKVTTGQGWFAARPSGTENIYKLYAESFRDEKHLQRILDEARELVGRAIGAG